MGQHAVAKPSNSEVKLFHVGLSTPAVPSQIKIGRVNNEAGTIVAKIGHEYHALNFRGFRGPRGWLALMQTPELFGKVVDAWARNRLKVVEAPKTKNLLAPIVSPQKIFGAGVVYESSMRARRIEELTRGGATEAKDSGQHSQYDGVYDPKGGTAEVFYKGEPAHVSLDKICFRTDSPAPGTPLKNLPEPEIVIYLNERREPVAYSLGSDTTACYFEGTSTLRLPQAKTYPGCMTLQRRVTLFNPEKVITSEQGWPEIDLSMTIFRDGQIATDGKTSSSKIVRPQKQIIETLARMSPGNFWEGGAVISTGTGIIPDGFTLQKGDKVVIKSRQLGVLTALAEPIIFDGESPFTI